MASTNTLFVRAKQAWGDGASTAEFDWVNDTIKAILVSSSYVPNYDTHATISDITNELVGNGYARQTLTAKAYTKVGAGASAKYACKSDKVTFTASGTLTARRMILFKDTGVAGTSILLADILLDNTPADVSSTTGIEVTPDATNGWILVG